MVAAYADLIGFIGEKGIPSITHLGPALSILGVFTWTMTMSREFNDIWIFHRAINAISGTKTHLTFDVDGRFTILSLGPVRTRLIGFVQMVRFGIGLGLWVCGSIYIMNEINLGELMLNCKPPSSPKQHHIAP